MFKIQGTTITLTRGDSLYVQLALKKAGQTYTPEQGDVIRFGIKQNVFDTEYQIEKVVPNDTLILHLAPEDTNTMQFGTFVYDLEMDYADGDIDTFVNDASFVLVPEVVTWSE